MSVYAKVKEPRFSDVVLWTVEWMGGWDRRRLLFASLLLKRYSRATPHAIVVVSQILLYLDRTDIQALVGPLVVGIGVSLRVCAYICDSVLRLG